MKALLEKYFPYTNETPPNHPRHNRTKTINPTVFCEFNNSKGSKCQKSPPKPSVNKIFLKYREHYIEFLENLCRSTQTGISVQILASKIFDIVNSLKVFSIDRYEALAVICWSIATKFEWDDIKLGLEELKECGNGLDEDLLKSLEVEVLELLDWKITRKTSLYYVDKYREYGYVTNEEIRKRENSGKIDEMVGKYSATLAQMACRVPELVLENDKIIACSCIAFARKKLGLRNNWTCTLEEITGIEENQLRMHELEEKYYCMLNSKF
ncbi:hypothetical protein SteCoe_15688 [Stentor coeruleus]|uniref:Cyclin N-terminal domain-containing protein n=1 Tax=Stentor coeruleus TaxID=5963 RepID=A0A1R2C336_9CILI|nr:hypothetical protein SteCoe_15688 [Stentor coeruleus]